MVRYLQSQVNVKRVTDSLILFLFSFFLLLIAGGDGFLRMPNYPGDASWFFMAGKSWMSGLIPYRDFADSKGPLIWLIYGLGYLISGNSLRGLFGFEVIAYWLNFYVLYRTALLLSCNRKQALVASMTIAILYFYPGMHSVMRIEDYCHLFQSTAFYILVKAFIKREWKRKYAFILGLCAGCTLMMKYAYFLTLLVPSGMVWIYLIVSGRSPWRNLLLFVAGVIVIALPFVIYFLSVGALNDFIREYFINTGHTIVNVKHHFDTYSPSYSQKWPFKIWYMLRTDNFWPEFLRIILVGLLCSVVYFRKNPWMWISLILWWITSVSLFAVVDGEAYYLTLCILVYGGICGIIKLFKGFSFRGVIMYGACYLAFVAILTTHYLYSEFHHTGIDTLRYNTLSSVGDIINEYEIQKGRRPTITNLLKQESGEHIMTNAIAGTRYYAYQSGMSPEMEEKHIKDVFELHPDFVIVRESEHEIRRKLTENGYKLVKVYIGNPHFDPMQSVVDCLYVYNGD